MSKIQELKCLVENKNAELKKLNEEIEKIKADSIEAGELKRLLEQRHEENIALATQLKDAGIFINRLKDVIVIDKMKSLLGGVNEKFTGGV